MVLRVRTHCSWREGIRDMQTSVATREFLIFIKVVVALAGVVFQFVEEGGKAGGERTDPRRPLLFV